MATFDVAGFRGALGTRALGHQIEYHASVTSTMTLAKERLQSAGTAAHGAVTLAEEQTKGIGRRDRPWRSAAAGNIYVSFIWAPTPTPPVGELIANMMKMNFAVGVAVARTVRELTGVEACVKWPNDVWIGNRKLSGCLVDCDGRSGGVVGIGVNIHETMSGVTELEAVSLADVVPHNVPAREVFLSTMFGHIERLMDKPWSEVLAEYQALDMLQGRVVRVHDKAREVDSPADFNATVVGFLPNGNLQVLRQDLNQTVALSAEEVSLRPA